ncbi:hypothetical protein [uncultured Pseudacidovorax sp.]|uniref:hypothetical protein n=1 Tax=uncultured Pseudacidovorax sp. TaxID=679313 RepID=UPI0025F2BA0B|nr:hypothetical protein [uncultured Pseudacidovorax sp.]
MNGVSGIAPPQTEAQGGGEFSPMRRGRPAPPACRAGIALIGISFKGFFDGRHRRDKRIGYRRGLSRFENLPDINGLPT